MRKTTIRRKKTMGAKLKEEDSFKADDENDDWGDQKPL